MSAGISSTKGRLALMALVLLTAIGAYATLFYLGRGGRIHPEQIRLSMRELLEVYLPLIVVMGGFYFGEASFTKGRGRETAAQTFAFAFIVTGLWVVSPIVFLLYAFVEEAMRYLAIIKPFGESVAMGAVAFYFAKSHG